MPTSTPTDAALDPANDAIDPTTGALLAIFDGPLRDVRFPDVDADILHDLAGAVRASAARVAAARAALLSAQATLVAAEQSLVADESALLARSQRALAYAHVYAAGDAALRDRLDAIHIATHSSPGAAPSHAPPVAAAPRRRGRPRKHPLPAEGAEPGRPALFAANDASPATEPSSTVQEAGEPAATGAAPRPVEVPPGESIEAGADGAATAAE